MKRSIGVSLLLLGTAAALSSCGYETPANAYSDAAQCVADGKFGRDKCESDFAAAKRAHDRSAPRFADRRDCERETMDTCDDTRSGGGVVAGRGGFTPRMGAYLMGSSDTKSGMTVDPQPLYRSASAKGFTSASGDMVTRQLGAFNLKSSTARFSAARSSSTFSRGGFGVRAVSSIS